MNVVVGIDLGTQGVRSLAVDRQGNVQATTSCSLSPNPATLPGGWHEQNPEGWWQKVGESTRHLLQLLPVHCVVDAVCVTSTSGSVVAVDTHGAPIYPAIMYNDERSQPFVSEVRQSAREIEVRLGYAINATFAIAKIVWLAREQQDIFVRTQHIISPTDFIIGCLSGNYGTSDYSNMLKSCYDLVEDRWPDFIQQDLNIPLSKLPDVVAPGTCVAKVSLEGARTSGLPRGTPVIAGATDGVASQIASGAVTPGCWNSTLGTTLVIKGISESIILDPQRRIYCHRHPDGWWMPGGASNCGAEWITCEYPDDNLKELDRLAWKRMPTGLVSYPLARTGERFPFRQPKAEGFLLGTPMDQVERFAAGLEGVAMLERLAYDTLLEIGATVGDSVYVTGGGARSLVWLRVRSSMLQRLLKKPKISETAMGAVLLAASQVWFNNLSEAVEHMVQLELEVEPNQKLIEPYQQKYQLFTSELKNRGYI